MTPAQRMMMSRAPGPSYRPESLAIFAAFTTPPTDARKTAIDTLVKALKSAGIWSQLDLLYLLAAADNQAARINWINPGTFTASPVNSPTFVADRGYTGDGSSARLNTQFTPSTQATKFTLNSASLWAWSRTDSVDNPALIGGLTTFRSLVAPKTNGSNLFNAAINIGGNVTGTGPTNSSGLMSAQRTSSTTGKLTRNGSESYAANSNSGGVTPVEIWICGLNPSQFSNRQIAAAAVGASLNGVESDFYHAVLSYMQSVGAA